MLGIADLWKLFTEHLVDPYSLQWLKRGVERFIDDL